MRTKITSLLLAATTMTSAFAGDVTVKDADINAGESVRWTKDNTYFLDGFVFVEDGATLTIEAGTVIKGIESPTTGDNASALIISRGAKIMAEGTADMPIIFTAEIDDVSDETDLTWEDKGLWGGLIILGKGKIAFGTDDESNVLETNVEGIPSDESRALFGGTDDADNSGVLKYVSVRHGGAALSEGNEINGITLGAVGSGTTMDYIEVFANDDDGIEWFGGTVAVKHAAVSFCGDDSYDFDFGWRGKGQFWLSLQGPNGDNGGEHDGAKPDGEADFSNPTIYNATYFGSGAGTDAKNSTALHFRDNTAGTYANSIFTDFAKHAVEVEDLPSTKGDDSRLNMENGDLKLLNNIWYNFGADTDATTWVADNGATDGIVRVTKDAEDTTMAFLVDHLNNNNNVIGDPGIGSVDRTNGASVDPMPAANGIAYDNLAALPSGDSFFSTVDYKGAFGDTTNWTKGWTAINQALHISLTSVEEKIAERTNFDVYPNPVADELTIAIENDVEVITVTDIAGKVVRTINVNKGSRQVSVNVSDLNMGTYFVKVNNSAKVIVKQ